MLQGSSGKVAFTVRLPEALHRQLKIHTAEQSIDLQDAMADAVKLYLSGPRGVHPSSCPLAHVDGETVARVRAWLKAWERTSDLGRGILEAVFAAL